MKIDNGLELVKLLDEETGEVREGAFIENYEGGYYKKGNIEKINKFRANKKSYDNFTDIAGGFSFLIVDTLKELHKDTRFSDMEKARIIFLGTFCSYESSGRYLFTNNNRYILKSDLQKLLEISNKKEFYTFYNKLVDTGILKEQKISRLEIRLKWNSNYHFKGKTAKNGTKSTATVKAYDRQIQTLYKEKDSKGKRINTPKNLFILFMVLPFIHKESGVLCKQPQTAIEEAEPLELKDLADMFGYPKPSAIKSKLLQCKLHNTNVFHYGEGLKNRKKYTRIYVNPFVANRSPKAPNSTILAMFPNTENAIVKHLEDKRK